MTDPFKFEVKITAVGEVRDADGNLLSTEQGDIIQVVTEDELLAQGITPEQIEQLKEGART